MITPVGIGLYPPASQFASTPESTPASIASGVAGAALPTLGQSLVQSVGVLQAQIVLSRTQLQTLNTTPVTIAPAAGNGKWLFPLFVVSDRRFPLGGTYGATTTGSIFFANDLINTILGGVALASNSGAATRRTDLYQVSPTLTKSETPASVGFSSFCNQALVIRGSANATLGNANDSVTLTVVYWVLGQVMS